MTRKKQIILLIVLILAVTAFIFSNSLKGSDASHEDSGRLLAWFQPLMEWLFGEGNTDWSFWLRKTAHIVEFCTLGVLVSLLIDLLKKGLRGYDLFYVLAVAVVDEFIQSFTGRTSQVLDILIDFSGALLGFGIVLLIKKIKKRKNNGD